MRMIDQKWHEQGKVLWSDVLISYCDSSWYIYGPTMV